ncbi:hypothetical protein ACFVHB_21880 [Kitasatospora sp. NPDC127111]|uniref:hypothetical protein n=1 Tax=Kitasatospora sp. NPDC127111 TaxID=3345363 RepID=UPI0036435A12
MAERESTAQIWGAAVVVGSALAVVAGYLINGAALVLAVAGVEVLLLMVYVGRRWQRLRRPVAPRGHQAAGGSPDAAHCERCRRAREALDAREARSRPRSVRGYRPEARPAPDRTADRKPDRKPDRTAERSADRKPDWRAERSADWATGWTAERAAARSLDRSAARPGAPGSAGRAVRHQ